MNKEEKKLQTSILNLNKIKKESYKLLTLSYKIPTINTNSLYKQTIQDQIKILRPIEF